MIKHARDGDEKKKKYGNRECRQLNGWGGTMASGMKRKGK